jgi:FKBP-type peptidyl-prolyl cis-trans isomerase 2
VKIEQGKRVRVHARLSVEGGDLIEDSVVEYAHGAGTMLAGLETALAGLEPGEKKTGSIPPESAFGNAAAQPTKKLARAEFPKDAVFDVGATFAAKGANGQEILLEVVSADAESIEVKFVHPLASKTIAYDVEVLSVQNPPPPIPPAALKPKA